MSDGSTSLAPYASESGLGALAKAPSASNEEVINRTVAVCLLVQDQAHALTYATDRHLRMVREAGRLLTLVHRSSGGRPRKNASGELTSYQRALSRAGISRQTAHAWRRVAAVPDEVFARFVEEHGGCSLTIAHLLRQGRP